MVMLSFAMLASFVIPRYAVSSQEERPERGPWRQRGGDTVGCSQRNRRDRRCLGWRDSAGEGREAVAVPSV